MGKKKIYGVVFDMADPVERSLLEQVEGSTDDFSQLVKSLLRKWALDCDSSSTDSSDDKGDAIRKSGLPFG
ncbi:hypothetical protein ACFQ5F_13555 [Kroppenstedtia eburnea]|uniref:Uncharacterized protein n=1 Tax=Kroppenstedtia eburnea TaxID=714067 RepID=A0A1N7PTF3_9BACL|nr:hypothetical protein [Kroppenstedtia eburnea]EGK12785.1 PKHD-type hydroxylase [Desmospora sp. 8437]QKI82663.1 hypothetical protein GXN75_12055 [Kroppenstedtia eburnea]SIT13856.1 hypothetical protein SAMN05421790_11467 [Kroppenstedtia eburnea]